jgi:hypothetical protein
MISSVLPPPISTTRRCPGDVADAVRDAEIDQPRLFLAADDLYLVAEKLLGAGHELGAVACLSQGVGADDAQAGRRNVAQSLTEARQAIERPLLRLGDSRLRLSRPAAS